MFVEVVALALLVPVMSACVLGRVAARRGRSAEAEAYPATDSWSRMAVVTPDLVDDLPLVAPEGAGYGVASRLLVQAALDRRAVGRAAARTSHPGQDSRAA